LRAGVELEDGHAAAKAVRIVDARQDRGALRIVMTEGRKREVRRMLAGVGLSVRRLVRLRVGPILLGNLPPAQVRELTPAEVRALARAVER
jgi:23S rRNA pseudouridine2605 synthase